MESRSNGGGRAWSVVAAGLAAAVLLNRWSVERLVVADQTLESSAARIALIAAQVALFAGAWLLSRPAAGRPGLARVAALGLGLVAAVGAFGSWQAWSTPRQAGARDVLARVDRAEAFYLHTAARLKKTLDRSFGNLVVADHYSADLFADEVLVRDLAGAAPSETLGSGLASAMSFEILPETVPVAAVDLDLWRPLFERVDFFERTKLYIHLGEFTDAEELHYAARCGYSALARLVDGSLVQYSGKVDVGFVKSSPDGDLDSWVIERFETSELHGMSRDESVFEEVLDRALPDASDLARARRSLHEEKVLQFFLDEDFERPHPWFTLQSFDRHPGLAVADVDGDGHDDLYVMARWGANQLLLNDGQGQFNERAEDFGLELVDHSTSALFLDLDNDGALEAVVGRSLEPSRFLEREGERFVDVSDRFASGDLPALTSSIAAADVNRDGMLDLYFSTYASNLLETQLGANLIEQDRTAGAERGLLADYLTPEDSAELQRQATAWHGYQNRVGPPNVLLLASGDGSYERVRGGGTELWRNTYQSTFGDADLDGYPDLYAANDFAVNDLLMGAGDGTFENATEATATGDIGFGMGSAWGDYDGDGDDDLYVANMFSKAGQRIIAMVPGLDESFANMARGNTLFRNDGETFAKVSSTSRDGLMVENGGWSWGGQFLDFDNDGHLDIYTLSGYYTAPKRIAKPVDT